MKVKDYDAKVDNIAKTLSEYLSALEYDYELPDDTDIFEIARLELDKLDIFWMYNNSNDELLTLRLLRHVLKSDKKYVTSMYIEFLDLILYICYDSIKEIRALSRTLLENVTEEMKRLEIPVDPKELIEQQQRIIEVCQFEIERIKKAYASKMESR